MSNSPTPEHKEQGSIPHSELLARLQDALHVARLEGAASLSADTFAAAISALSSRDTEIREVLEGLVTHQIGSRRPCWCPLDYGSEPHTELCEAASALYAKLQPGK